jgi:hypothetical protein
MRRAIISATLALWLLVTVIDGYRQISKGVSSEGYGYETQWEFLLIAFLFTRFIVLLVILAVVLVLEFKFLPKKA